MKKENKVLFLIGIFVVFAVKFCPFIEITQFAIPVLESMSETEAYLDAE